MTVSRETLARFDLGESQLGSFDLLLEALAGEEHPPTTVRDPARAAEVHLADSLVALELEPLLRARAVADIGAGAGFPGLALAVALPRAKFDLLEANQRKCEVIERLGAAAGLSNARAVAARAEHWAAGHGASAYDVVTARAVGPLAVILEYAAPLLKRDGALIAWKGRCDLGELEAAHQAAATIGMMPLSVHSVTPYPGSLNRSLHVYLKVSETPSRFPRRAGIALKRPIGRHL